MGLQELKDKKYRVHIVGGRSSKGKLYCYDTLRNQTGGIVIRCDTVKDFNNVLEGIYLNPIEKPCWFVVLSGKGAQKGFIQQIKEGLAILENSYFILEIENWGGIKEVGDKIKKLRITYNTVYTDYIRTSDILYLFEGKISDAAIKFISRGYVREPEKVYTLYEEGNWDKITPKLIVEEVGYGSDSIPQLVIDLIKFEKVVEKKPPLRLVNRVRKIESMVGNTSPRYVWVAMVGVLKDFITIKEIYLTGKIYKKVPKGYERYGYMLSSILNTPIGGMVEMYGILCGEKDGWYNGIDVVEFLYSYIVRGEK